MNTNLLITFIVLNIANVIIQTFKSLITINGTKFSAAVANAVAYGLYTVVTIYLLCDLPLLWKALIVALCNFIGVFAVKWFEEKARKDKLWKVEATVKPTEAEAIKRFCETFNLPFSYIDIDKYVIFNFYCATQKESALIKDVLDNHNAKYFVSESKTL
jgi:hypothetical protein